MCSYHRKVAIRRQQTHQQNQHMATLFTRALDMMWDGRGGDLPTFAMVIALADVALAGGVLTPISYERLARRLRDEWDWFNFVVGADRDEMFPKAVAATPLARLAVDKQNVHTREINAQTRDGTAYLLETPVPAGMDTLAEIATAWSSQSPKEQKKVMGDIRLWYTSESCVTKDDALYKRMLDGLWTRIKEHTEKQELIQRLWEETSESVNKCCQGHLSRLVNVLVGFTEEVKAEVSVGEVLQQKMSAIASKDVSVESKVLEAQSVFDELKVPVEERTAWIEAF